MADPPYSLRMERTSYKSQDLIYEEPGFELVVYLELSGLPQYTWVGSQGDLETWTAPAASPIPASKRDEIAARIETWAAARDFVIQLYPQDAGQTDPVDYAAYGWDAKRRGNKLILTRRGSRPLPGDSLRRVIVLGSLLLALAPAWVGFQVLAELVGGRMERAALQTALGIALVCLLLVVGLLALAYRYRSGDKGG